MKAWVLRGNGDMQLTDVPKPQIKTGEVLVAVKAAGICSSDIPRVFSGGAYHYPIILGHEFSGITEDGRRVGVFPLIPCRVCDSCQEGHYETCSKYSYIGSRQDGAFAEYVAVPEWNLVPLPGDVSFEEAAMLEPAAVALHARRRLEFNGLQKVAVVGDGVIGQLIAKWLEIYGMSHVVLLGHDNSYQYAQFDACFEVVGSVEAFRRCIDLARPNGQIVVVGNPNEDFAIGQKLYWQILRKQLTVRGSWNSGYPHEWKMVLEDIGKIGLERFNSHRFSFEELDKALDMMYHKKEKYCKVLIEFRCKNSTK